MGIATVLSFLDQGRRSWVVAVAIESGARHVWRLNDAMWLVSFVVVRLGFFTVMRLVCFAHGGALKTRNLSDSGIDLVLITYTPDCQILSGPSTFRNCHKKSLQAIPRE